MEYELLLMNLTRSASSQAAYFHECIGQHSIAAYLHQHDFRAKVYSGDILSAEQVIQKEIREHGVRCLGFYVGADTAVMIGNLIQAVKQTYEIYCFAGGPEAVALGEAFLRKTGCDAIVVGEGEQAVLKLLSCLEDGAGTLDQIPGLRWIEHGVFHESEPGEPLMDLDALPWPRREDSLHKNFRMGKSVGMLTGRGCPFHCAFCFEGAASKLVRLRSVEHVMGEIDEIRSYNPALTHVNFFDDTFTLQPERVRDFCRELKKRGLFWTCEGHVACLYRHPEMLEEMVDAGLTAMQIGVESGSQRVLDAYQKNTTPEMIEEVVRLCHRAGLPTLEGNYIIGGAYETEETLEESLAHAKRLLEAGRGMMELKTVFFAPYYGTPITKNPEKYGIHLLPEQTGAAVVSMHEPAVRTDALSAEDLAVWKKYFDDQLWAHCQAQAAQCTRSDLLRGKLPIRPGKITSYTWYREWIRIPHLREFLQHATLEEQTYSPEKYPIRTGVGQRAGDGILAADGITLDLLHSQVWQSSDGRSTAKQLAGRLNISSSQLERIYRELNHRCLVYFSPY